MKYIFKLLPLLLIYFIIIILFSKTEFDLDEDRYIQYANNILHGYYANPENPILTNGPGYPLYLSIFLGLKSPLIVPKIFNGILIFIGLIYFYEILIIFTSKRLAIFVTYILGLYFPMLNWMTMNMSESFVFILICAFTFYSFKLLHSHKRTIIKTMVPSIILALLILTKVIFAYVTLAGGAIFLVYFFLSRSKNSLKFFTLLLAGFILSSPYFFYTYSLTGKYFYLSTASGLGLYWMSSKYVNEYGSGLSYTRHELHPNPEINQEHQILFNTLKPYSVVERNEILINKAIENIKNNPKNYMLNVISNVSRLIFNFPHSLRYQTLNTHWYLIFNFILMIGLLSSFYPAWINRKYLPDQMVILGVFFLIYFCGSCLVIGHSRFFLPVVPYILLWTTYIYTHYIQISFVRKQNLV